MTNALTSREGDEERRGHEQDMQHHQPGVTRGQLFVGTHPHPRVLRPVGRRSGWIHSEIVLLVPFRLGLPMLRVAVIVLSSDCENDREDYEKAFRKRRGAVHPRDRKREGRRRMEGKVSDSWERRLDYISIF